MAYQYQYQPSPDSKRRMSLPRLPRMGRSRDGGLPTLLLAVVVTAVLVYIWTVDKVSSDFLDEVSVRPEDDRLDSGRRRFALVSMSTKETSYDHMAMSNKFYYAQKHGYDFRFHFKGPLGIWDKLTNIETAIRRERYDWIWCLDYDTLITNSTITLDDVVDEALAEVENPDDIDMILTPDCFPLNVGAMLLRATPWTLSLLAEAWKCSELEAEPGRHYTEQDCIQRLIESNTLRAKEKTVIVRQWKMNAFPPEVPCYDDGKTHWERGMFVIHFAGAWAHVKEEDPTGVLMRRYWEFVE